MSFRFTAAAALWLLFVTPPTLVEAQPTNTRFVIINNTGFNSSEIYVKFLGSPITGTATPQTYGKSKLLEVDDKTSSKTYALTDMLGLVPNSPYQKQPVPTFSLNSYSGGRIYFSFGKKLDAGTSTNPIPSAGNDLDPDYDKLYQYIEPFVAGGSGDINNMDLSYVDFVGMPIDIAVRTSSGGYYQYPNGVNPQLTQTGNALVNALKLTDVPEVAYIRDSSEKIVRVVSPSVEPAGYHTWDALLSYLQTWVKDGKSIRVASYTVTEGTAHVPPHTLFGYSGRDNIPADAFSQAFWPGQSYDFTAEYLNDLNPDNANPRIGIPKGTAGFKLTGSSQSYTQGGNAAGEFSIYIKHSELAARTGIWGNNPAYVIDWTSKPGGAEAYTTLGIQNDLTGRIVGDLLAGILFGWAGNTTYLVSHATATKTTVPPELTSSQVGELSTGEFFYLLSAQPNSATLAAWWGAGISSNPNFYSSYGTALTKLTNAYTSAFGDRLQGPLTPSIYWAVNDITSQGLYVEITLNRGAYDTGLVRPLERFGLLGLSEAVTSSSTYTYLTTQAQKFTQFATIKSLKSLKLPKLPKLRKR